MLAGIKLTRELVINDFQQDDRENNLFLGVTKTKRIELWQEGVILLSFAKALAFAFGSTNGTIDEDIFAREKLIELQKKIALYNKNLKSVLDDSDHGFKLLVCARYINNIAIDVVTRTTKEVYKISLQLFTICSLLEKITSSLQQKNNFNRSLFFRTNKKGILMDSS